MTLNCKGSIALGSACGHCENCRRQLVALAAMGKLEAAVQAASPGSSEAIANRLRAAVAAFNQAAQEAAHAGLHVHVDATVWGSIEGHDGVTLSLSVMRPL